MHPRFHPRLINGPYDDPGLYVPFLFENRAIIFDLGNTRPLSTRDLLKLDHIFITHTHIDHFIGFDRILRVFLGRKKNLHLYGPRGFLKNVEGKLAAYTWNLVKNYKYKLGLYLTEVRRDCLLTRAYLCQNEFVSTRRAVKHPFNEVLYEEPAFKVTSAILDHDIPCLGFAIKERFHININRDRIAALQLHTGPWLTEFKGALYAGKDTGSKFEIKTGKKQIRQFRLGDLADQIAMITPGQKITYITDVVYNSTNKQRIVSLAKDSDHLFIEAAFLETDKDMALEKNHLTARQAGVLAAMARVKQFTIFHFSPRYTDQAHLLRDEARQAYEEEMNR